jgi:PKD repeat protein
MKTKYEPKMFLALVITVFAISALFVGNFKTSAAVASANAGTDLTVFVGEAMVLNGNGSTDYIQTSQADGTFSIRWQTGDGFDCENLIKCPHVYQTAGTYTATLTVKNAAGQTSTDTATVTALAIPQAAAANIQTLIDTGNPDTNRDNLQKAVNRGAANAAAGEIRVPAGFVFNDPLILPKRTATNYLTIRVSNLAPLAERVRVTAADKAKLFRMNARGAPQSGYNNALEMSLGASYYRIIGLEIRKSASETNTDLVGQLFTTGTGKQTSQHHFIMDRCLIDGNGFETRKGVVMNGEKMSLLNSSVLDIKAKGTETKAFANWTGAGPVAAINNRLDAAAINVLIGGSTPRGFFDILDGFAFRGNYVWKNPAWQGAGLVVKNLFELKQGYNTVSAGNVFENNYEDGQSGEAILIKSMTDEGNAFTEVGWLDFRNNKVLNTRAGFNVVNMQAFNLPHPPYAHHIRFFNNFWEEREGRGNMSQGANYFEVNHNTFVAKGGKGTWIYYLYGSSGVPEGYKPPGYKLLNNIAFESSYGLFGDSGAPGNYSLNMYLPADRDIRRNLIPGVGGNYPTDNFYPAAVNTEFVNYTGGDFSLKAASIYKGKGTDGKDLGVDWVILNQAVHIARSGVWLGESKPTPAPTPQPSVMPSATPTPKPVQ